VPKLSSCLRFFGPSVGSRSIRLCGKSTAKHLYFLLGSSCAARVLASLLSPVKTPASAASRRTPFQVEFAAFVPQSDGPGSCPVLSVSCFSRFSSPARASSWLRPPASSALASIPLPPADFSLKRFPPRALPAQLLRGSGQVLYFSFFFGAEPGVVVVVC
jgi:hypothetical protein